MSGAQTEIFILIMKNNVGVERIVSLGKVEASFTLAPFWKESVCHIEMKFDPSCHRAQC